MGYKSKFTGEQIDALLEKAGQGGGGSASSVEYFDVSSITLGDGKGLIVSASSLAKISADLSILPPSLATIVGESISMEKVEQVSAVAVDLSAVVYMGGTKMTLMDLFAWASIPRITEEEFYTL